MPHKRAKKSVRDATRKTHGKDQAPGVQDLEKEGLPKGAMRILNSAQTQEDFRKRKREEQNGGPSSENGKKRKGPITGTTTALTKKKEDGKPAAKTNGGKNGSGGGPLASSSSLKIVPGESLGHFNRRVEDSLRANVTVASKKAQAHSTEHFRQEKEDRKRKHDTRVAEREEKKRLKAEEDAMSAAESDADSDSNEKPTPSSSSSTTVPKASREAKFEPAPSVPQPTKKARATEFEKAIPSSAPKRLNDIAQAPPSLTFPRLGKRAIEANAGSVETSAGARVGLSVGQARILAEERERVIARYREIKEKNGLKGAMGLSK